MPKPELRPISIDRAKNRLAYDIKTGATETLRGLHSKLLAEMEILDKDLAALDVSMTELEAGTPSKIPNIKAIASTKWRVMALPASLDQARGSPSDSRVATTRSHSRS